MPYYKVLDSLRFFAAFGVIIAHWFDRVRLNKNGLEYTLYEQISSLAQHGVTFFFVLSGFLITNILMGTKESESYFKNFYIRRSLRIFPLYYLGLIIYYYVIPPLTNELGVPFKDQLPYYLYLQGLYPLLEIPMKGPGHYWSLAVEEHFYLIWPLIVYFARTKRDLLKILIGLMSFIFCLKIYMISSDLNFNHFSLVRMEQILMGGLIAILGYNFYFFKSIKVFAATLFIVSLLFVLNATVDNVLVHDTFNLIKNTSLAFLFMLFLSCILAGTLSIGLLDNTVFQYFGRISYGIYVYHLAFLHLVYFNIWNFDSFWVFAIYLGGTILMSSISFHFFEKYFLRLKRYF